MQHTKFVDGIEVPMTEEEIDFFYNQPEPPPQVPISVSMAAAREALIDAGLIVDVNTAIGAIPDEVQRTKALSWWEYAQSLRRDNQWVLMIGTALGLTEQQVDDLFIAAKQIELSNAG